MSTLTVTSGGALNMGAYALPVVDTEDLLASDTVALHDLGSPLATRLSLVLLTGDFTSGASGAVGTVSGITVETSAGVAGWSVAGLGLEVGATIDWFTGAPPAGGVLAAVLTGNDTITGAHGADTLFGFAGDDVISGGNGADTLRGGLGKDRLSGGYGNDTLYGFDASDTLFGNQGADRLFGEAGNDVLHGGLGNDRIDGGVGVDTASYFYNAAVTVSLAEVGEQNTGGAGRDTLVSIENLAGGAYGDMLTGAGGSNLLYGNGGEDWLVGLDGHDQLFGGSGNDVLNGGGGNDTLSGGVGTDTASYAGAGAGVRVNLGLTTRQDTQGAGLDLLSGIENLSGSGYNDHLTGSAGVNRIQGGSGADQLTGGGGADTLLGGAGSDMFVFRMGDSDGATLLDFSGSRGEGDNVGVRLTEFARADYFSGFLTLYWVDDTSTRVNVPFTFNLDTDLQFIL